MNITKYAMLLCIAYLKGNPVVMNLRLKVRSIEMSRGGKDPNNYLVLSLGSDTISQFLGRLTLRKDDAHKMDVRAGGDLVIIIKSVDYEFTAEELERKKRNIEQNPELGKLHYAEMQAKVTAMHERYSAPDGFSRVSYEPYKYYLTAFNYLNHGGMSLLPIKKDWASMAEISVGDLVSLKVTTPLR